MRQMLTVVFALSLLMGCLGCGKKGVELDVSKTVAMDPTKDKLELHGGPGGSKGKGAGAAPVK